MRVWVPRSSRRRRATGLLKLGTVAAAVSILALLGGVLSASRGSAQAVASTAPPSTVRAALLPTPTRGPNRPGTLVSPSKLGMRVFVGPKRGFALATLMLGGEATYPAATVDGGKTWRVAGPVFHIPAANAPNVVTQVGAARPTTYFAYGGRGGGDSVIVTTDAGKHWWRARFGAVYAVVANSGRRLLAFTPAPGVYYSNDGGWVWHHSNSVASVP